MYFEGRVGLEITNTGFSNKYSTFYPSKLFNKNINLEPVEKQEDHITSFHLDNADSGS